MTAPVIRCHYCPATFPEAESIDAFEHVKACGRAFRSERRRSGRAA